jgi:hypothetical protein
MKKINELWTFLFILVFWIGSTPGMGAGKDLKKPPHRIPQVTSKIKIDGVPGEKEWDGSLVLNLNYEVIPGENIEPPVKTEVFLAYDEKHLYVAYKAYDPEPSKIRARITDRDKIFIDDYVGIVLDTFNDSRLTHDFYCNPFGIQADRISTLSQGTAQWDAIWNSAGRITKEGYCVEMAIPFTSLRFQGKKGNQVWGIDVVRSYPRNVYHTIGLFPRDRNNNCYMCQADKIIGFSGAKPGKNLEFDPTLSAVLTQEREAFPEGKFIDDKKKVEPGLTARWSFTPNMSLNAAINPDFSQVEADTAQLDINTQFALYYPERRPFFLEGRNIFQSRLYPVYTRTVADPEWGIKLTGKEGKHAIGFFTARDTVTNLLLPSSESSYIISLDMKNTSSALRYRCDVGKSSNIGIFITDREGQNYYNRLVGIDFDVRFKRTERLAFQYLASQTRYPGRVVSDYNQPEGKFSGGALDVLYAHSTRHVNLTGHYQEVTPNFRSDVGFTDQTGTRLYEISGGYTWRKKPGYWYTYISAGSDLFYLEDCDKRLLRKYSRFWINYNGPLQSYIHMSYYLGKRTYLDKEFNSNFVRCEIQGRPSGSLFLGFYGNIGDQVDYANVRNGSRVTLNPYCQYNIGRHLSLGVDHIYEKLNVDAGRLYTANLTNLTSVYQFNRRVFLRVILQYVNYQYNPELYLYPRDPVYKNLFSQVLFSYKINPQTVLFLGYSDDYYGYHEIPLTQNNRTLFLKIGYALVL